MVHLVLRRMSTVEWKKFQALSLSCLHWQIIYVTTTECDTNKMSNIEAALLINHKKVHFLLYWQSKIQKYTAQLKGQSPPNWTLSSLPLIFARVLLSLLKSNLMNDCCAYEVICFFVRLFLSVALFGISRVESS